MFSLKKINVSSGKQDFRYFYRACMNSYTCQYMIVKHKQQGDQKEITTIRN